MMVKKNFSNPDETRAVPKTTMEIVTLGEGSVMRAKFEAGWKWSECVKPVVGTDTCQAPHLLYFLSGRMVIRMDDGSEKEFGPGDVGLIPPGHDAWIVGNEACVALDFHGGAVYAKS